ncbi:hypothetical protein EVAR_4661_1 [Eumeta japonica]|uniref:Uncharacterized protein n=1 Tax=Eumeta variegata TaxID=151549 RepID=A0A4C1YEA1_EUMVA|nr:hypothetical protein EVAR_4661_1 [Eumeta japonica]
MDTRNVRGVTCALPAFFGGNTIYNGRGSGQWTGRGWKGSPEFSLTGRNASAETTTLSTYSVRVWFLTGMAGPILCCSQVGHKWLYHSSHARF